jgi:hypothetical protein
VTLKSSWSVMVLMSWRRELVGAPRAGEARVRRITVNFMTTTEVLVP